MSLSDLHHAIRAKEADRALEIARGVPHVPLRYVARIVALLVDVNHPLYDQAARRFLVRAIAELEDVPMVELKRLADVLAHVHHSYWSHDARSALQSVVVQLHKREEPLWLTFDSVGNSRRVHR